MDVGLRTMAKVESRKNAVFLILLLKHILFLMLIFTPVALCQFKAFYYLKIYTSFPLGERLKAIKV